MKDKLVAAKAEFRELLQVTISLNFFLNLSEIFGIICFLKFSQILFFCQETKFITHKSLKMVQENESHLREIEEILKKDKRYLILDYMPDERTRLLRTYLEELDKRGPPPPPTASEPSRRPTK